jgi:MioC protein
VDLFRGGGLFIICTSTYGEGEVPENGKALLAALRESGLDLSRVRYGVFGLGDRHHAATFCWGAKHFDEALSAAGATRLGEIGRHDLREPRYPEEHGLEWLSTWLTAAGAPTPQGE